MTPWTARIIATTLALLWAWPAAAHEFWIAPNAYQVPAGGALSADIRVGENFEGSAYAYLPRNFERFEVVMGDRTRGVEGRPGDRPALAMTAPGEGLAIVVHQTRDYDLTYRDWQKFENFVTHKDARWALADHAERNLPREDFEERYSRYGKALIAVGHGRGADRAVGLLTEIVAEDNPYTDPLSDGLGVRVLYKGAPRTDAQIELFERAADGTVSVTLHRTDGQGRARLPVKPGHEYLVDAVVLRAVAPVSGPGPVWESLWASLTFRVPG